VSITLAERETQKIAKSLPARPGWVENGLAAALRLAFSPLRGCCARRALPTARFEPNKCPPKAHDSL
jgi:hypothetical protein